MTLQTQTPLWTSRRRAIFVALALIQLAVAYIVGTGHLLSNEGQSLLPPIGVTVTVPVVLFLVSYALSARFRSFVLAQDIRRLTMLQHWRVMGFGFLLLYAYNVLPGLFAWPAGVGDVAVGIAATFMVARIDRNPDYVTSTGFVWFNIAGLFDFVVAVVTSGLATGRFPQLVAEGVTAAPMDVWPLNIFPSFVVPAFIILHLTVLLKVRALRRAAANSTSAHLQVA